MPMARDLGVVGSGGDSAVRGDGHSAGIGGITSIGRSPVERQQGIERPDFGAADPGDDVGQISFRVDPVQPAGFHQAVDHRGDAAGGVRAEHVPDDMTVFAEAEVRSKLCNLDA